MQKQLDTVCQRLLDYFQQNEFKGYDPFDGLNSALFQALPIINNNRFCKLAWLQLHKRLPVNLRPFVGIGKSQNPKAIALIIMGLVYAYRRNRHEADLLLAKELAATLLQENISNKKYEGRGWGYPFPWQARAFFVDRGAPNIIVTSFVASALALLAEETKESVYSEAAIEAGRFVIAHLYNENEQYFFYVPSDSVLVHNANLWGAVTVARAGVLSGNTSWIETAKKACQLTADAQRQDGSWVYGALPHHQFIDGFHTGYNLETLKIFQDLTADTAFTPQIQRGFDFYLRNFFDDLGRVKYYHDADYPLDVHSVSQAILTISKLGKRDDLAMLSKVIDFALNNLYSEKRGIFHYQKHHRFTNKIVYLRWTQAWMYYSLNHFLCEQSEIGL